MKGIILAGGSATRIKPITDVVSKQLLPVYDKPMIYYPLSVLMLAGVKDILVISTPEYTPIFMKLLDDGSQFGIHIEYKIQEKPKGLPEAFILGEKFIDGQDCALILGDNILWGDGIEKKLSEAIKNLQEGYVTIFGRKVSDPEKFGIAVVDEKTGVVKRLIEKPKDFVSNLAVIGLYFYKNDVCNYAKLLNPSKRGELEITDLNIKYLEKEKIKLILLEKEKFKWFDAGSFEGLFDATESVRRKQTETSLITVPEAIAYKKGWISQEVLLNSIKKYDKSPYGSYLKNMLEVKSEDIRNTEKVDLPSKSISPQKQTSRNARKKSSDSNQEDSPSLFPNLK